MLVIGLPIDVGAVVAVRTATRRSKTEQSLFSFLRRSGSCVGILSMDANVIIERGLLFVVVVVCGVVYWASAAGVDIVAMLTVCALCVCVSIATRVYGLIVTGCSVGGVSLITELVVWLSCSTSNIGDSCVDSFLCMYYFVYIACVCSIVTW